MENDIFLLPWTPMEVPGFLSIYCRMNRDEERVAEVYKKMGSQWRWWINPSTLSIDYYLSRDWRSEGIPPREGHEKRCTRAMKKTDAMLVLFGFVLIPDRLLVMK